MILASSLLSWSGFYSRNIAVLYCFYLEAFDNQGRRREKIWDLPSTTGDFPQYKLSCCLIIWPWIIYARGGRLFRGRLPDYENKKVTICYFVKINNVKNDFRWRQPRLLPLDVRPSRQLKGHPHLTAGHSRDAQLVHIFAKQEVAGGTG